MNQIVKFLSAEVPGGIYLLLFILLVVNLTFWFFRNSDLISRDRLKKNVITANVVILLLYVALWFVMQPPKPQMRVVVLPAKTAQSFTPTPLAFAFADAFTRQSINNTSDQYLVHRWYWLYETLTPARAARYENWMHAARAMQPRYLIETTFQEKKVVCTVTDLKRKKQYTFEQSDTLDFSPLIAAIQNKFHLFKEIKSTPMTWDRFLLQAQLDLLNGQYDKVIERLKERTDVPAKVLTAAAWVKKGLERPVDFEKMKYVKITIPEFEKARAILVPIVKEHQDTPLTDLLLGRMAIRLQKYSDAEVFLKKAYVDDPENARVYFQLSFLLPERLKDIGYQSRIDVLRRAVYFDPGYRDAVYQLANEIYLAGIGTLRSSQEGIDVIEEFLKIQPNDPEMRSLLGLLYTQTHHPDKALPIFQQLQKEFPNDPNSYYNLGICYFLKKQDSTALKLFMKAIHMAQHRDSYLYVAMIYNRMGKLDSALKYFRERVKRQTGDDDKYATEAMYGIQTVLAKMEKQKHAAKSDSSDHTQ